MAGTDLYAVAGKPVLHSLSPEMHNAAFATQRIDAYYIRLGAESAEDALRTANAMGIRGMNVTAPFKEGMAAHVRAGDEAARKLGAINTVIIEDGIATGYNTDPDGVSGALNAAKVTIRGKKAVVLGAGGAAKAAVLALKAGGAIKVTVVNRTPEKARVIAEESGCESCALSESKRAIEEAGMLVSALSTVERMVGPESLHEGMAVLDANYSAQSALALDAQAAGCKVIDGREWLLFQGATAYELFRGRKAPIGAMRKAVYAQNAKHDSGNIALVGMMGSGKDAVSSALSEKTGRQVVATDKEIERETGREIRDIFAKDGEAGFRKRESEALCALQSARNSIINCGGGAVVKAQNRKILKRLAAAVWLWADIGTILTRVPKDGRRPLLDGAEPEKKLGELLAKRRTAYAQASDLVLDTVGRTPKDIAGRILYEIH